MSTGEGTRIGAWFTLVLTLFVATACTSSEPDTTVACNDGTGNTDCCPDNAVSGEACSGDLTCSTQCVNGWSSRRYCTGGHWVSGKGLFPCGDAVPADGGAGGGGAAGE